MFNVQIGHFSKSSRNIGYVQFWIWNILRWKCVINLQRTWDIFDHVI